MSTPAATDSALGSARRRLIRWRWPLAVAAAVVLAAAATALATSHQDDTQSLGPDNPGPEGAAALAALLRHQGVEVTPVQRSTAAIASSDPTSTLVITNTLALGPAELERLATDDAAVLVLVEPDEVTLSRLAPQVHAAGVVDDQVRAPGCSDSAAVAAGRARAGGHLYSAAPGSGQAVALCYPDPTGYVDSTGPAASYLSTRVNGRPVLVIGQSQLLTNAHLEAEGNAALGLWALGQQPSLVWYRADPLEQSGSTPAPTLSLLPDWVFWALVQLGLVSAIAIAWRARRLGRLVPEPLPVVVRAAETQEGRARLYQQAGARDRAASTLRAGTLRRLAARLAVPPGTTAEQLVAVLSTLVGEQRTGRVSLAELLLGPSPTSDAALVRLADDLDTLERELSRHDLRGTPR